MLAGLILAIAMAASPPPAVADPSPLVAPTFWIPSGGSDWIDFEQVEGGQITIPVVINGRPARALIDTGYDQLVLSKRFADAQHLAQTPWGVPVSVGGPTPFYSTTGISMDIGAIRTTQPGVFMVSDFSRLDNLGIKPFDAVIGLMLLGLMEWQVDEDHHRIRFLSTGSLPIVDGIPVHLGPNNSRLLTAIVVNGIAVTPTMIDLGSDQFLDLAADTAKRVEWRQTTDMGSMGAGGAIVEPLGKIATLVMGSQHRTDIDSSVNDDWNNGNHTQAIIGMGLLRDYNLLVDISEGVMLITPRAVPASPAPKSTSGVQGSFAGNRLTITHVMKNSPAATAGVKSGDAICKLNGRAMSQRLSDDHWGRAAPGTRYILGLCDGTTKTFTTRAFY